MSVPVLYWKPKLEDEEEEEETEEEETEEEETEEEENHDDDHDDERYEPDSGIDSPSFTLIVLKKETSFHIVPVVDS